mgnify:CR=1 FL=1
MSERQPDHPALDKVLLLMVSGLSAGELASACTSKLGVQAADVDALIASARRKLTVAAEFNRDEKIGEAVTRLNDLYARAIRATDLKTSAMVQRELNKLLGLYWRPREDTPKPGAEPGESPEAKELAVIREHLEPLNLAPKGHPIREIARIAAEAIRGSARKA